MAAAAFWGNCSSRRRSMANPRVRVLGFTDQMCAYMQASDLLISKAGGLTTAEAVASRTPLLYLNAVPGCESRNIGFMRTVQLNAV